MASYNTLRRGDKNDEVKQLQEKLIGKGYDLGSTGADGSYGPKTQAAVEKYQSDNGLQVTGVAGDETLGKLYSSNMPGTTAQVQPVVTQPAPSYRYDPQQDTVYQAALQKLQEAQENKPTFAGTYDEKLQAIYDKIMNREPFSYDLNGDALWHQYKDQHVQQGQLAAQDVMGQAAALTGGYGNSYGQKVAQQTYNQHLQQLGDKIPELYQLARNMYDAEGSRLAEQYALTGDLAADEYGKHQDQMNLWLQNLERARADADAAYDRGENSWYTEHQLKTQADETDYARKQDAYNKLVSLITSVGYTPSREELAAAGMRASEAAAYAKVFAGGSYKGAQPTPTWGAGIDTTRNTGAGQLKGSAWDYSKNNLSQLLRNGKYDKADEYMEMIVDQLDEDQFEEVLELFKKYGYSYS